MDLQRVREQARVRYAQPRRYVNSTQRIGDGVGRITAHRTTAHQMRSGYRGRTRPEAACSDPLIYERQRA
jgi:hypothetical protein